MKADWKEYIGLKEEENKEEKVVEINIITCGIKEGDKRLNIKKLEVGDLGEYAVWERLDFNRFEKRSVLYDVSRNKHFWNDCVDIIEECADGTIVCHEVKTETRTIGDYPIPGDYDKWKNDVSRKMPDLVNMVNTKPYQLNPNNYEREADLYGTCNITVETYCSTQFAKGRVQACDGWYKKLLHAVEDENNSDFKPKRYFWYYLLPGTNINIYSNGDGIPYIDAEPLLLRVSAEDLIRIAGTPQNRWNGNKEYDVPPKDKNDSYRKILIIPLNKIWQPPEGGIKKYIDDKAAEEGISNENGDLKFNFMIPTHKDTGTDAVLMTDFKGLGVARYLSKKKKEI